MPVMETVTAGEACRMLGISLDYVYRMLVSGQLTGTKDAAGQWRIPASVIAERLKKRQ